MRIGLGVGGRTIERARQSVQAAYDAHQGSLLAEGTAVWASEHFDPTLGDLEGFAQDFFAGTDRALTSDGVGPPAER